MKKYLPWIILSIIIVGVILFLINIITPSPKQGPRQSNLELIKKCGQKEMLSYCSGAYQCTVLCNHCGCDKPICKSDVGCKTYFERNFKIK